MSLETLMTRSLVVVRRDPGTPDSRNIAELVETSRSTILAWLSQIPASDQEIVIGRETLIAESIATFPEGTAIDGDDQVIDEAGQLYEVVGFPNRANRPSGEHHVEVFLKALEGA